jgi:membrane associated rhomboid family serine protease
MSDHDPAPARPFIPEPVRPRAPDGSVLLVPAPPPEDLFPGYVALGPVAGERKARDWALVLQSMSIEHAIRRGYAGWILLVRDADYARAAQSIDGYEAENRDWPPRPARERSRHAGSPVVPAMFAVLVAFFLVTGPAGANSFWFERGVAVSSQVLTSEPWRAVTALTLHADSMHVLGNAVSGTVFVSAVQRRLGAGGAALAVLATGVAGNVANAVYHHLHGAFHASLGASTAVFGAIGLLAATQLVLHRADPERRRTWMDVAAPIVGGFALLGALGAGGGSYDGHEHAARNVDLGAHLFGLLAGLLIGLGVAFPLRRATLAVDVATGRHGHEVALGGGSPRWWVQTALGAIALAIVVVSWQLALRR